MSDGTIARLPANNMPSCDDGVMLLLPHNKYLLGRGGKWVYAPLGSADNSRDVFLYDSQSIALSNDDSAPTVIPAEAVNMLRSELMSVSEPPGNHTGAVLMLRTFMKSSPIFQSANADYLDEKYFLRAVRNNSVMLKAYWTVRFAMTRGDIAVITRLKAWLRAGAENFSDFGSGMKIWFSLLGLPSDEDIADMEALSFSRLEITRMTAQNASPVVLYNQISGWLVLGRFGRARDTMFFMWAYLNHDCWNTLREVRKLSVNDILLSLWGEYDVRQAVSEREKYRREDDIIP